MAKHHHYGANPGEECGCPRCIIDGTDAYRPVVMDVTPTKGINMTPAKTEWVNHPAHYGGDTTYEVIKVLETWGITDFCLGNAIKYIARHRKKNYLLENKQIEDLEKAVWYLQRRIQQLKSNQS
jgi:hypothetical protein